MNIIESLFTRTSKCKIYIYTPTAAISERVQKALFTLGYYWAGHPRIPKFIDQPYVVIYRDDMILCINNVYDSAAYPVESDAFLHNSILKKLH